MADRAPAAWLELLERRLHDRWSQWSVYDDYYEGNHNLTAWLRSVQRAFQGTLLGRLLDGLTDNYMPLVVDSVAERMRVQGFRLNDAEEADKEAARIWRVNGLKAQANMLHTEAIKLGEASWLVEPRGEGKIPRITCEHPSQVIVATAPGDRSAVQAALKKWNGDDGFAYANVYLPQGVAKYRAPTSPSAMRQGLQWVEMGQVRNPLNEVPVVPLANNPSMLHGGQSDLAFGATGLQDQIEKSIADLLIGAEYHGLPQRVMLGVEPPRGADGKVIADSEMQKARLWYFNQEGAKAHEFSAADLKGLRDTADGFIGDLAAQTRIPIYYFRPQAISNISAEALIGLDAGLVSKAKDKEDPFGDGHTTMMRLAFKAMGRDEADIETFWANTESRSIAQVVDAAVKKDSIGVPWEQLMEDIGYSPEQIDRMQAMRDEERLLGDTADEPPAVNGNGRVPAVA